MQIVLRRSTFSYILNKEWLKSGYRSRMLVGNPVKTNDAGDTVLIIDPSYSEIKGVSKIMIERHPEILNLIEGVEMGQIEF